MKDPFARIRRRFRLEAPHDVERLFLKHTERPPSKFHQRKVPTSREGELRQINSANIGEAEQAVVSDGSVHAESDQIRPVPVQKAIGANELTALRAGAPCLIMKPHLAGSENRPPKRRHDVGVKLRPWARPHSESFCFEKKLYVRLDSSGHFRSDNGPKLCRETAQGIRRSIGVFPL